MTSVYERPMYRGRCHRWLYFERCFNPRALGYIWWWWHWCPQLRYLRLCSDSWPCSGVFLSRNFIIVDCMIAGQVVDYNKCSTFDIQPLKGSVISVDFNHSLYRQSRFVLLLEDICSCDYLRPVWFRVHSSWSHITNNQGSDLHSSHLLLSKI